MNTKEPFEKTKEAVQKTKDKSEQILRTVIFRRVLVIAALLLLQVVILVGVLVRLGELAPFIFAGFTVLGVLILFYVLNQNSNPAFKMTWMLLIAISPILGGLLYLFVQTNVGVRTLKKQMAIEIENTSNLLTPSPGLMEKIREYSPKTWNVARYLDAYGGGPAYSQCHVTYFPLGEDKFKELLVQLEKAEDFIFLEYFIVEEGHMWNSVLEILERKAAQGVEVRIMYDGMGSLFTLKPDYFMDLRKRGLKAKIFNPVKPLLSTSQNYRDHRKILVIDGKVAFNGGINMADEYINEKVTHGHWKDVAIMVTGEAVDSFTLMFLQMWNVTSTQPENYARYLKKAAPDPDAPGFLIPYCDSPVDGEHVGENVYLDMLYRATDYVHIMSPYLIITNEMVTAMTSAAKSGVDVKLILPHIPDKWFAFVVARSFYADLLSSGVKIYEYTPGFVHAKVFVSDDEAAVVGTINLDYRSLYHHFECATYLYRTDSIAEIEADFQSTLEKCEEVTLRTCKNFKTFDKIAGRFLRIFAPLL